MASRPCCDECGSFDVSFPKNKNYAITCNKCGHKSVKLILILPKGFCGNGYHQWKM